MEDSCSADYNGQAMQRKVDGFADARFRLSVNLYGAPALTLKEFQGYQQDLIIGASLSASVPAGQYDATRLVNIGANRWSLSPEAGVSKALGPLTSEVATAAILCGAAKEHAMRHIYSWRIIRQAKSRLHSARFWLR